MNKRIVLGIGLAICAIVVFAQTGETTVTGLALGQQEAAAEQVRLVQVTNFPDPQRVTGGVTVTNLPSVQTVNGEVAVSNLPMSEDGSLRVSCPSGRPDYQFFGDIFGGPEVVSSSMPELTVGTFDIDGAGAATLFIETTPDLGSTQSYDFAVFVDWYFDGPPAQKRGLIRLAASVAAAMSEPPDRRPLYDAIFPTRYRKNVDTV